MNRYEAVIKRQDGLIRALLKQAEADPKVTDAQERQIQVDGVGERIQPIRVPDNPHQPVNPPAHVSIAGDQVDFGDPGEVA